MMNTEFEYLALVVSYPELLGKTILKKEYFQGHNRMMFEALTSTYQKFGELVLSEMVNNKNFDANYFAKLLNGNLYHSSKEIKFKILEKEIIENFKSEQIKKIVSSYNGNNEKLFKDLENIKKINTEENEYIKAQEIVDLLEEENKQIKLGFTDLDKNLCITQGDFVVIAGGTGTGKTTFALNLLSNLSKTYQCVYFNMEMSKKTLYRRLTAIETGIDVSKLSSIHNIPPQEKRFLYSKLDALEDRRIILVNGSQTIDEIEKCVSRIKDDRELVVILDHIGLIKGNGYNLYEQMTNVAKRIRGISVDHNCTIFGLCQLSRESQKEEREPKLQDLRDSGEIEQSARKVLLLYNKDLKKQVDVKDVDVCVAKNDDGNYIVKSFKFNTKKQKFLEIYNEMR